MREIFVDTGYWVALLNYRDALHDKASSLRYRLSPATILVTSEMVLNEVLDQFSSAGPVMRQSATKLILQFYRDPKVKVIPQTQDLFSAALQLYRDRPDKSWSHTDCSSFCIMTERGIREALAHDRHFEQAGFVALLR